MSTVVVVALSGVVGVRSRWSARWTNVLELASATPDVRLSTRRWRIVRLIWVLGCGGPAT
jgi:hypothetical protein